MELYSSLIAVICLVGTITMALVAITLIAIRKRRLRAVQTSFNHSDQTISPARHFPAEMVSAPAQTVSPPETTIKPAPRSTLPRTCPSCGSPVRPNEVTWLDDKTAECAYCGQVLHGNSR